VAPASTDRIVATVGTSVSLDWPEPLERVAVADDSYARLQVVSRKELMVTGLQPGRTSLAIWLGSGRRVLRTLVVEPNLDQLRTALAEVNETLTVEAGPDAASIVLRGQVEDEATARHARTLVDQLLPRGW
jgi:Flp pilus assembly secretin CpaC